jgi:hypothetical protein
MCTEQRESIGAMVTAWLSLGLESSSPPSEEARRLVAYESDPVGVDVLDDGWTFAA